MGSTFHFQHGAAVLCPYQECWIKFQGAYQECKVILLSRFTRCVCTRPRYSVLWNLSCLGFEASRAQVNFWKKESPSESFHRAQSGSAYSGQISLCNYLQSSTFSPQRAWTVFTDENNLPAIPYGVKNQMCGHLPKLFPSPSNTSSNPGTQNHAWLPSPSLLSGASATSPSINLRSFANLLSI